jgi:hypothetical protein
MRFILYALLFAAYLLIVKVTHSAEWRKVVAVIDTGMPPSPMIDKFLCNMNHYDVTGTGITDRHGHGSNIAFIITSRMNVKTHCLWIIKWWDTEKTSTGPALLNAVKGYLSLLDTYRPAFVNLSLSGDSYLGYEANVLKGLIKTGSTIIVSAGNDFLNLDERCTSYPACYKINNPRFRVVGSRNATTGSIEPYSNRGKVVTDYESGNACTFHKCYSGTSQAAAHLTAKLTSGVVSARFIKGDK